MLQKYQDHFCAVNFNTNLYFFKFKDNNIINVYTIVFTIFTFLTEFLTQNDVKYYRTLVKKCS